MLFGSFVDKDLAASPSHCGALPHLPPVPQHRFHHRPVRRSNGAWWRYGRLSDALRQSLADAMQAYPDG